MNEMRVDHLPHAWRGLWHELPTVAACGVLVCAAASAAVVLAPGITPYGVMVAGLLLGPVWAGVTASADSIVRGGDGGVLALLRNIRRHALAGLAVGLVPTGAAAIAVLNWGLYDATGRGWLLAPAVLAGAAFVLTGLAGFAAFTLRIDRGLRGRALWYAALALVARNPVVPLGLAVLAGAGVYAGTALTVSLLPLVPGPVALLASAGTWTTLERMELERD